VSNGYENGKLPDSALAPIAQGRLAKDNYCAASWNAMNVEARSRGLEIVPTGSKSSYRTYEQQVELYNAYLNGTGNLAAVPGTSNHGWGLAVDVATQEMRSMIDDIGRKFGWAKEWSDAPSEWWHLKYATGVWSGSDPGPSGSGLAEEDVLGVACAVAANGNFHVFAEASDGSVWYCWQGRDSTAWSGGAPGRSIAGLSKFAPAP
jgi:hypothetical protein